MPHRKKLYRIVSFQFRVWWPRHFVKDEKERGENSIFWSVCVKNILLRGKNRSTSNLYLHTLTRAKIYRTTGGILPVLHVCNSEVLFPVADHSPSHFSRERTKATPRRTAPRFQDYLAGSVQREAWYYLGIRLRAGQNFQFGSSNFSLNRLSPVIQPFYDLTKLRDAHWRRLFPIDIMRKGMVSKLCALCAITYEFQYNFIYVYMYVYTKV